MIDEPMGHIRPILNDYCQQLNVVTVHAVQAQWGVEAQHHSYFRISKVVELNALLSKHQSNQQPVDS